MLLKGQIIPLRSNSFYKDMDPSETATHFSLDKVYNRVHSIGNKKLKKGE